MKLFTIIILNWNNYKETKQAIKSCLKLSYKNKKIIVVDNASSDASYEKLKNEFLELIHIQTGANLGYTGGNNVGIKKALELNSDYIMILNNDTIIGNSNFIENIINIFQLSKDIGIVGPVVLDKNTKERLDKHKNSYFENALEAHIDNVRYEIDNYKFKNVNRICGCGIIFSKDSLEIAKGFDESFFMYAEEQDICYRIKETGKFILKIEDENIAKIFRKNEYKENKPYIWYYITRNYFYLIQKHFNGIKRYKLYILSFLSMIKKIVFVKHIDSKKAILKGFMDFLRNKKGKIR
jgi:GT2 family glycosyltransferase